MGWFSRHIARFRRNEEGTITIEFVIVAPIFIVVIAMGFEFFDAFKSYNRAHKASYAVADLISRDTLVEDTDIQTMHAFLDGLLPWMNGDKTLRVSSIMYKSGKWKVMWSKVNQRGKVKRLIDSDIKGELLAKMPSIAEGDTIILTETAVPHRPLIDMFEMSDIVWENTIIIRPRFLTSIPAT